jgi:hypothetical protein
MENKLFYFKAIFMSNLSYKWIKVKFHSIGLGIQFKQWILVKNAIGGLAKNVLTNI